MVKRFIPLKAHVGPKRISEDIDLYYGDAVREVRDQFKEVLNEFYRWTRHMDEESAEVLREALEPTFQESQALVPKKTEALMRSGYLEVRKFRGKAIVEIGYGKGGIPNYAIRQHEDLDLRHKDGEQAKFLEEPLTNNADEIQSRIAHLFKEASGVR